MPSITRLRPTTGAKNLPPVDLDFRRGALRFEVAASEAGEHQGNENSATDSVGTWGEARLERAKDRGAKKIGANDGSPLYRRRRICPVRSLMRPAGVASSADTFAKIKGHYPDFNLALALASISLRQKRGSELK